MSQAAEILLVASLVMLVFAGILALYRLFKGPSSLDRAVAVDLTSAVVVAVVVILIAWLDRTDLKVLLIVFALTAFFSTVTVSRFAQTIGSRRFKVTTKEHDNPSKGLTLDHVSIGAGQSHIDVTFKTKPVGEEQNEGEQS